MNKQYIYRQIENEYAAQRDKNEKADLMRKEALYKRLPAVKAADTNLKQLGIKLVRLTMLHSSPEEINKIKAQIAYENSVKAKALISAGLGKDYLAPTYTCTLCKDTGYIGSNKCACMKKKLIEKYYSISNLDNILKVENFNNFNLDFYSDLPYGDKELTRRDNMLNILKDINEILSAGVDKPFNFYLYGSSGLGKTFMCSCIAKELLDKGHSVIYMTAYSLATVLQNRKFNSDNTEEDTDEAVEMLYDADLLIIDDLGTESPNSFTVSEFFNIINARLINNKSTIISSNLKPGELSPIYSDRIVSRIIGRYNTYFFYGNDIRMK